ncbi:MAG: hypothetical protein SOW20_02975 [Berryella intestinalis]|uniref:hypothetical protein n=1 Tax=Berryella intestinalis TaxID=1531429 RepID=UPI002A4ED3CA|nr:hypothetical protein [Berryella intestinalis]MDD7368987.1 hypothetical protein [Berryella intestinalis]MDY3128974.1 hypothetical protein [Berryella intestinalis]
MRKFSSELTVAIASFGQDRSQARLQARVAQVQARFKGVVERVYPDAADLILQHVNAVYITREGSEKKFSAYVDESIFAAELNAQREMMKLMFFKMYGEDLSVFDIHVSRGTQRHRHPFSQIESREEPVYRKKTLSREERAAIESKVSGVQNDKVRTALGKAMVADFSTKMGKTSN